MDVHNLRHKEATKISIWEFKDQVHMTKLLYMKKKSQLLMKDQLEQVIIGPTNIVLKNQRLLNKRHILLHLVQEPDLMNIQEDHKVVLAWAAKDQVLRMIIPKKQKDKEKLSKSDKIMLRAEKRLFKISLQRVITETFQNKILKIIQKLKVII